jgi:hypothetical protein
MPYKFDIDQKTGTVLFSATGVFSPVDFLYCIKEVVEDPRFETDYDHLVDLRAVKYFVVSPEVIHERVLFDKDLSDKLGEGKIAIVSSTDVVNGISKMYENLMKDSTIDVKTFMNMNDARRWLRLPEETNDT